MLNNHHLLAHYDDENQQEQTLTEHLSNTAKIAYSIGKNIGIGDLCFLLGAIHDVGKAEVKFQTMLKNMSNGGNSRVIHSTAGAYFLFEKEYRKLFQDTGEHREYKKFIEICMYVIEAHHGLFDIVGVYESDELQSLDNVNKIFARIEKYRNDSSYDKKEILDFVDTEVGKIIKEFLRFNSIDELIKSAFEEYLNTIKIFNVNYTPDNYTNQTAAKKHKGTERRFFDSMLVRLLLSILKSADVKDTINAFDFVIESKSEEEISLLKNYYIEQIEAEYKKYNESIMDATPINQVRNKIANKLLHRGKIDVAGIYRLDVPTGAGKTKASLRYALHQMAEQSKNRFIYITAFLSVLEQNAKEIKSIIGEEGVLEHHSNVDIFGEMERNYKKEFDENEDRGYVQNSFVVDTWDSQVVLTTMVQFFNTLFKGKSANLRRFTSLINSVIVIDEVQSLPIEAMYLFNLTMNFLKNVMKCTIVLCTATQPIYDHKCIKHKLEYGGVGNCENVDLVDLLAEERKCFDRYSVKKFKDTDMNSPHTSPEELAEFVLKNNYKSTLVVVNTKAAAKSIVECFLNLGFQEADVYYLSTNLCPAHRKKIIEEIKERLLRGEKIICVSTQLIEAGVNVDFARVMRSYAGMDSIIQVAGRCNREGSLPNGGEVILFNLNELTENTKRILGIADKKKITEDLLSQVSGEIHVNILVDEFYNSYYSSEADGGNRMEYPLGKDKPTLLDSFIGNKSINIKNEKGKLRGNFRTVADNFQLISDDTEGVFVYYEAGIPDLNKLLCLVEQRFISNEDWVEIKRLVRKLQPYSINVYRDDKLNDFITSYFGGEIKVLQIDHYNGKYGATKELDNIII